MLVSRIRVRVRVRVRNASDGVSKDVCESSLSEGNMITTLIRSRDDNLLEVRQRTIDEFGLLKARSLRVSLLHTF